MKIFILFSDYLSFYKENLGYLTGGFQTMISYLSLVNLINFKFGYYIFNNNIVISISWSKNLRIRLNFKYYELVH